MLNLQIARAYLAATDPALPQRTWQHAMDEITNTKTGPTSDRWQTGDEGQGVRPHPQPADLIETHGDIS